MSADFSAKRRLNHPTPTIYCDSHNAIYLIRNPVYHAKTNLHIKVRFHHIRELVTEKKLEVRNIGKTLSFYRNVSLPSHMLCVHNNVGSDSRLMTSTRGKTLSFYRNVSLPSHTLCVHNNVSSDSRLMTSKGGKTLSFYRNVSIYWLAKSW